MPAVGIYSWRKRYSISTCNFCSHSCVTCHVILLSARFDVFAERSKLSYEGARRIEECQSTERRKTMPAPESCDYYQKGTKYSLKASQINKDDIEVCFCLLTRTADDVIVIVYGGCSEHKL